MKRPKNQPWRTQWDIDQEILKFVYKVAPDGKDITSVKIRVHKGGEVTTIELPTKER